MARQLAAIKVRIGLRRNGHADHPNFNLLPIVQAAAMDWAYWVDAFGLGWMYDKKSGHDEDDIDSPAGVQYGMLCIPEQFAIEAIAEFPTLVTRMTEAECEDFHDNRSRAHVEDVTRKDAVLISLDTEMRALQTAIQDAPSDLSLKTERTALIAKTRRAYDPSDPQPGLQKNFRRRWADVKVRRGVVFKEA